MKAGKHGIGAPAARAAVLAVAPGLLFVIKPVMGLREGIWASAVCAAGARKGEEWTFPSIRKTDQEIGA